MAEAKLEKFLTGCKTESKEDCTHVRMGKGSKNGKYSIPEERLEKFYKYYTQALEEGTNPGLLEMPDGVGPIVIDMDFKQDDNHPNRSYTEMHVKQVVQTYLEVIGRYLKAPRNKRQCFVLEKEQPENRNGTYHDGIHMMFPFICATPELQMLFRKEVVELVERNEFFKNVHCTNSVDKVFDKAVITGPWFMYGSGKRQVYQLTHIYGYDIEDIPLDTYQLAELPETMSIRGFEDEHLTPFKSTVDQDDLTQKLEDVTRAPKPRKSRVNVSELNRRAAMNNNMLQYRSNGSPMDLVKVRALMPLMSDERADDRDMWLRMGFALHNIDNSLLADWIEFSRRSGKFQESFEGRGMTECEYMWQTMERGPLGMGSIYYWAKEDNPEAFSNYQLARVGEVIKNSYSGTPYDIAKVLQEKYGHQFRCASHKHKIWYEFRNHRWSQIDEGYSLLAKISEDLVQDYCNVNSKLYNDAGQAQGPERDLKLADIAKIQKIIDKLKQTRFKADVMTEARTLFYDVQFLEKLDETRHLLGFENGVLDLETMQFRHGCPEDYISMTTGVPYQPYEDADSEILDAIDLFFRQIQPKDEMREYVMRFLASCLQGHIVDQKFPIWTGTGSNGKSACIKLMQKAFGDYCCSVSVTLLTQKQASSSNATPDVARIKGTRFAVFQEPEENDKIHVGRMKELTGGDKLVARALYREPIEFFPQCKLLLACNQLPHIPSNDGGTWRRLRVVEFASKFVREPDPNDPRQFPIVENLEDQFEIWKIAFMSLMVRKFEEYKESGLEEPAEVRRYTEKYQESSDVYLEFIHDEYEETGNNKDSMMMSGMFATFTAWFKQAYSGRRVPNKREFEEYMKNRYNNSLRGKTILGIKPNVKRQDRLMDDLDDDEDD